MKYVLALDQGTTSSRAILFDEGGAIAGIAQQELSQSFPRPGRVEHDPEEIWSTQAATAIGALRSAGVAARDVAAIGITNQRETTILWDRATGEPIHPAIVWQDRRTVPEIERLQETGDAERVRGRTGLVPDAYFSASKIRWLLDHVPGARERAARGELAFGTVDSWLVWRLTGGRVHATDVSNASRTMLFGLRSLAWDEDLLRLFDVPRSVLPEVRSSSEVYAAATEPPELAGIPIAGIAGDQQAALFGQLCVEPGRAKCTYGTGCFLLLNTGTEPVESANGLLSTVAWRIGDATTYAMEGSVFIGGAVVQWLRDGLGIVRSADEIEALAASVPDSGGVYLVPAFAGLGAPHWDPRARGTICGLTRGTTAAHLARAALESITFQVADLADAMAADSGRRAIELRVDGGAAVNDLLMQIQADLLGVPVVRPRMVESTALGAALLAGIAVGVWRRPEDLGDRLGVDHRFAPARPSEEAAARRAGWRRALDRSMDWER